MQPLDLRMHPPRGPRQKLGGLYMLARTIDKLRATLPGGNLGEYHVFFGLSKHMADRLGIDLTELADVVRDAGTEDDVVAWVRARSDPSSYDRVNLDLCERTQSKHVPPEHRQRFESKYAPEVRTAHENLFDLIEADDRHCYVLQ
jgi:hypothetical protein